MNGLTLLQKASTLAIDSADLKAIEAFSHLIPHVTTNPTLVSLSASDPSMQPLLKKAMEAAKQDLDLALDYVLVYLAQKILSTISGEVSLEIDPRDSFNKELTLKKALRLADLLEKHGISRDRFLLKIAGTWEGIEAAKELEKLGIRCNITIILSLEQAIAAHAANVTMIACYVARVKDWYVKHEHTYNDHPGITLAKKIFATLAHIGSKTKVMAASFRNSEELFALAHGPILIISPRLLQILQNEQSLAISPSYKENILEVTSSISEESFRKSLKNNDMATDKLHEAIELFCDDVKKLEALLLKC